MTSRFIAAETPIFCGGCGHRLIAENTEKALNEMRLDPKDVILVSDIGCHGILDKISFTHTMHGLHGRAAALAAGTAMGLNGQGKKIIVLVGDGGATIGLQHLVDAAVRNVDLTVLIHNNMLYGMTGGQASGLTPCGFKTPSNPEGKKCGNYDISSIISSAGGSHVRRLVGKGDFSGELLQAFKVRGFSLVEILEQCTSYGAKFNAGKKIEDFIKTSGMEIRLFPEKLRPPYSPGRREGLPSLFRELPGIPVLYKNKLKKPLRIILSGSAGEGVQLAAELFAEAGAASGLHVTKKGSYPVTVGVGFSSAEIIISPERIFYSGIDVPDALIITSVEGLRHASPKLAAMKKGLLMIDASLELPRAGAGLRTIRYEFRKTAGPRSAAFLAAAILLKHKSPFPSEAFEKAVAASKIGARFNHDILKNALPPEEISSFQHS